jgi:hypothetical protein
MEYLWMGPETRALARACLLLALWFDALAGRGQALTPQRLKRSLRIASGERHDASRHHCGSENVMPS